MSAISYNTAGYAAPRLHLTKRGRGVITFLVAVPLAIAAAAFGLGALGTSAAAGAGTGSAATFQYVTVDPGESLWQVAETIAPTVDPRDVVADILTLNNLSSGDVQAGQRLAIPTKYDH